MSKIIEEIFTIDNLWHFLAGLGISGLLTFLIVPWWIMIPVGIVLFYLRELNQVHSKHGVWDFTLMNSLHKHMEWATGAVGVVLGSAIGGWLNGVFDVLSASHMF